MAMDETCGMWILKHPVHPELPDEDFDQNDEGHHHQLQERSHAHQEAGLFLFLGGAIFRATSLCTGHDVDGVNQICQTENLG